MPCRRLEHHREARPRRRTRARRPREVTSLCRATGQARGAQRVLHRRLVAEELGGLRRACPARRSARAPRPAGPCSGSRMPMMPVRLAVPALQDLDALEHVLAVSGVGRRGRRRRRAARPRPRGGVWTMPRRRTSSSFAAARAKRMVVSSGNGATKMTLRGMAAPASPAQLGVNARSALADVMHCAVELADAGQRIGHAVVAMLADAGRLPCAHLSARDA